jgi:addiction module HigA family antidote
MRDNLQPVHPGEILLEDFLKPMGISQYALAKAIEVPARRINEIVHGKRAVTADTDLRLCRFFGLSDGYWLRGQSHYDTAIARASMIDILARIRRYDGSTPATLTAASTACDTADPHLP